MPFLLPFLLPLLVAVLRDFPECAKLFGDPFCVPIHRRESLSGACRRAENEKQKEFNKERRGLSPYCQDLELAISYQPRYDLLSTFIRGWESFSLRPCGESLLDSVFAQGVQASKASRTRQARMIDLGGAVGLRATRGPTLREAACGAMSFIAVLYISLSYEEFVTLQSCCCQNLRVSAVTSLYRVAFKIEVIEKSGELTSPHTARFGLARLCARPSARRRRRLPSTCWAAAGAIWAAQWRGGSGGNPHYVWVRVERTKPRLTLDPHCA